MAVSASYTDFVPDVIDLIERAYARCQRDLTGLSAEDAINAKSEANVLLKELAADGKNLWCVDDLIVPLYPYQPRASLPAGTRDILDPISYRTLTNVSASDAASSAGGTVANAFDADVETLFTQTAANGTVTCTFSGDTPIGAVGILPGATASWTLTFQVSENGTTWRDVYAPGALTYTDRVWQWFDIESIQSSPYFRMVLSGGGTLSVRELVFGQNPVEITCARMNGDDYQSLPTKLQSGNVPTNYWFDRQRDTARINVWPVVTDIYMHLHGKRLREMYDIATFTETFDMPRPWYAALIDMLALRLAKQDPKRTKGLWPELETAAQKAWDFIDTDEIDRSPINIDVGIGVYTS